MRGVPRDRRASSAAARVDDRHVQNPRRAADDLLQIDVVVELEPVHDAEARPQRGRQQPRPRRRADQRELLQRHLDRPRARPLADDDVELVVLHRRIQDLLDRRRHPVDLVDEQHLVLAEVRQNRREIAGPLEHRPGGRAHRDAELVADDVGERRLAEAREDRRAARGRAPRCAGAPRRSTPAGSRGRAPGRCSRPASGAGARPRTGRLRRPGQPSRSAGRSCWRDCVQVMPSAYFASSRRRVLQRLLERTAGNGLQRRIDGRSASGR